MREGIRNGIEKERKRKGKTQQEEKIAREETKERKPRDAIANGVTLRPHNPLMRKHSHEQQAALHRRSPRACCNPIMQEKKKLTSERNVT